MNKKIILIAAIGISAFDFIGGSIPFIGSISNAISEIVQGGLLLYYSISK